MSRTVSIWTVGPRRYPARTGGSKQLGDTDTSRERDFAPPCRSRDAHGRPAVHCARRRERETIADVSLREQTAADDVLDARGRYVSRGVSTPRLVVARAEGARVEAADGRG